MKVISDRLPQVISRLVFYLVLLLNLLLALQVLTGLGDSNINYFFSSDGLYLPSLYRDLFVDRNGLEGWNLNAAPNFFPEWPLYFLIHYITGDFRPALLIYTLVQFLLFGILISAIYRMVYKKYSYYTLALLQSGLTLFLLVYFVNNDFRTISYLFFQGYHNGAILMSLSGILLTFYYMKKERRIALLLLFIAVLLATLSDRLFIGMYTFPLFSMAVFLAYEKSRKRLIRLFITAAFSSTAGLLVLRYLQTGHYIHIISTGAKSMNFQNIGNSFLLFLDHMSGMILNGGPRSWITLITAAAFASGMFIVVRRIIRSVKAYRGSEINESPDLSQMFLYFSFSLIIIVILLPLVNGSYIGPAIFRYMIFAFFYAIPFVIHLIFLGTKRYNLSSVISTSLGIALVLFLGAFTMRNHFRENTFREIKEFVNYYPENARIMDRISRENDLKYGVANYWYSKHLTQFSKTGIRIYSVFDNLHPWFHVTNQNWFFHKRNRGNEATEFNFILGNNLNDKGRITSLFGNDIDTLEMGGLEVYKVPSFRFDEKTRNPVRLDPVPAH